MKHHLTIFAAIALPLSALAQGFGSFSHDQPFFAKDKRLLTSSLLSEAQYWFDAVNGPNYLGTVPTNGSLITSWTNLGVAGGDVNWQGVNGVPYYSNSPVNRVNGHAVVFGSGAQRLDRYHDSSLFFKQWEQPTTAIMVARLGHLSAVEFWGTYQSSLSTGQQSFDMDSSGNFTLWAGSDSTIVTNISSYISNVMVISAVFNYSNSYLRINGELKKTGNVGTNGFGSPYLMSSYLGGNAWIPTNGFLAELAIWKRELDTNELQSVENDMMTKWGTNLYVNYIYYPSNTSEMPPYTNGLILCLESDMFDQEVNGYPVQFWTDKSTNNKSFLPFADGNITVDKTNTANGHATVHFNGSNANYLRCSPFFTSGYSGLEVFCVSRAAADPPAVINLLFQFNRNASDSAQPYSDGNFYEGFGRSDRPNIGNPTTNTASAYIIYNVSSKADGTLYDAWINSENFYHVTSGYTYDYTTPFSYYTIGNTQNNIPLTGNIAAIYVFNFPMDSTQRANMRTYLNNKWGTVTP